jgi:hypothetical protein
MRASVT